MTDSPDLEAIAATDRVVVRPWRRDEADRFFDMHRGVEVARWIGGRPMHDRTEAVTLIERYAARLAADPRFGVWAVTHLDSRRSIRVCRTIGMRLLGVTHRWYHEPSLMFWAGATADGAPSLGPDEPAPTWAEGPKKIHARGGAGCRLGADRDRDPYAAG